MKFINEDTGILKTAVFCFSGKAPKTCQEMETIAINAGAQVTRSVNNKTTILVIADVTSMSCKAQSARDRDIDLISPSQFFIMCGLVTESNNSKQKYSLPFLFNQLKVKKPELIIKPTQKKKHSPVRRIEL